MADNQDEVSKIESEAGEATGLLAIGMSVFRMFSASRNAKKMQAAQQAQMKNASAPGSAPTTPNNNGGAGSASPQ